MRSISPKIALVALTVAATTLAGCQTDKSGSAQPVAEQTVSSAPAGVGTAALGADEILKEAKAALAEAKSFRAKGTLDQEGEQTEVDIKISGKDFTSVMAIGKAKVELLAVDGERYIRPNEQFWTLATDAKQGKQLAQAISGRWVTGADKDESFAELFTMGSADELLKPTGELSKGEQKEIGGVPAIGLKDAGDPDSVLYVATTGEPYPLQLVGKGDSAMVFSDFGKTFAELEKPAKDAIVDLGKLG